MASTRTGRIMLREDGCVEARLHPGVEQTLGDAEANLTLAVEVCGGRRRPLLVDISQCLPLEPEVRHFYTGKILVDSFLALALLVEVTPFGRMMGNVYLRVARAGIPTQLFVDEAAAFEWLQRFLK